MVAPITYKGYNSDGNCISTVTGFDANTQINPAEVKAAVEKINSVVTKQLGEVSSKLSNICQDASEAIVVQGTGTDKMVAKIAEEIPTLGPKMVEGLEDLYDRAVEAHDYLQNTNNAVAYNNCWVQDVVSVSGGYN